MRTHTISYSWGAINAEGQALTLRVMSCGKPPGCSPGMCFSAQSSPCPSLGPWGISDRAEQVTPCRAEVPPAPGSGSRSPGTHCPCCHELCAREGLVSLNSPGGEGEQGMTKLRCAHLIFPGVPIREGLGKVTVLKPVWPPSDNQVALSLLLLSQTTGEKKVKKSLVNIKGD